MCMSHEIEPIVEFWCPIHRDIVCEPVFVFEWFVCEDKVSVKFGWDFSCVNCPGNWSDWDRIERSCELVRAVCGNLGELKSQ